MFSSASRVLIAAAGRAHIPAASFVAIHRMLTLPRTYSWPAAIGLKAHPGGLFIALRKTSQGA